MERLLQVQWGSSGDWKFDTKPLALSQFFRSDPGWWLWTDVAVWWLVRRSDVLNLLYFKSVPVTTAFVPTWPFPAGSLYTETGQRSLWGQAAMGAPKHLISWLRPQKSPDKIKMSAGFFCFFLFSEASVCIGVTFSSLATGKRARNSRQNEAFFLPTKILKQWV